MPRHFPHRARNDNVELCKSLLPDIPRAGRLSRSWRRHGVCTHFGSYRGIFYDEKTNCGGNCDLGHKYRYSPCLCSCEYLKLMLIEVLWLSTSSSSV